MASAYDAEFFTSHRAGAFRSAVAIAPLVCELVEPVSVIDVGCGSGTWLAVFETLGLKDYIGVDWLQMNQTALEIPPARFLAHDLNTPFRLDREFDLVVCLEVAEHLPETSAHLLLESLTRLWPVVMFSAAIPGQGGTDHVNEQWPDYWVTQFDRYGFQVADPIRPAVWKNDCVEPWYAQNTLLFIREDQVRDRVGLKAAIAATSRTRLSIVHPRLFTRVAEKAAHDLRNAETYIAEVVELKSEIAKLQEIIRKYDLEVHELKSNVEKHQQAAQYYIEQYNLLREKANILDDQQEET